MGCLNSGEDVADTKGVHLRVEVEEKDCSDRHGREILRKEKGLHTARDSGSISSTSSSIRLRA